MTIRKLIVHLLKKQADAGQSELSLSASGIAATPQLELFLEELNKIYNSKNNKVYGAFQNEGDSDLLSDALTLYIADKIDFVEFSLQAMAILKHHIDKANKATGGYVLFCHYTLFGSDFMLIAMLNNVTGVSVSNALEINSIDYLDLSKIHLAARIDLTQWQEEADSERFISMIRARESHKLSEYFRKFIGSDDTIDSRLETNALFTAVNQYCDEKLNDEAEQTEIKKKAIDYCIEQADVGRNVVLKDFSNYVAEGSVDDFMNYINKEQFQLPAEVAPNKTIIRRFNKISGRNARLSITFNEELLGSSVIYNEAQESLTITELPENLKAQLLNRK